MNNGEFTIKTPTFKLFLFFHFFSNNPEMLVLYLNFNDRMKVLSLTQDLVTRVINPKEKR